MKPRASKPQPWGNADATDAIREIASGDYTLDLTQHASSQMRARTLTTGDVVYVLKRGFVHDDPQTTTQEALYKYAMESRTPNTGNRVVRVVVIPCWKPREIKVVTVMWVDENTFRK
jgi:hypothetical protein